MGTQIRQKTTKAQPLFKFICSPKRIIFLAISAFIFTGYTFVSFNNEVSAATGINSTINFQGKVVNKDGTNVADGQYAFVFRIYDVASAGTHLWTETQSNIQVTGGVFRVSLGSVTPISGVDFNTDNIYLGINFNSDGEMTPRIRFASVPYAFNAQKVAGLTVTDTTGTLTIQNSKTVNFGGAFTTSAQDLTLTLSGGTNVTLPTTGTLATLAGTENLSNKTFTTSITSSGVTTDLTTGTNEALTITPNGTGNVVINPSSGGQAALVVDKQGLGDIFAASAAGTTRFIIKSDGTASSSAGFTVNGVGSVQSTNSQTLTLGGGSTGELIIGRTTQRVFLPGFDCSASGNGGKLTTTAGGVLTCAADGGGSGGGSNWNLNSTLGTLSPINNTVDLLYGGTTTTSAKFAVLGVAAGANPTATLSAGVSGGLYISANGTLATTAMQTLNIGGSTTGEIRLNSGSVQGISIQTGNGTTANTGALTLGTGTTTSGTSGPVSIVTGNAAGASGQISLVGTTKTNSHLGNVNSAAVTFDSIPQDDDIILLTVTGDDSPAVSPPAGFTQLYLDDTLSSGVDMITAYYKRADGEASATYTVTYAGDHFRGSVIGSVFRGTVNVGNPFEVITTGSEGFDTTPEAPSITTLTDNAWHIVHFFTASQDFTSVNPPSTYTTLGRATQEQMTAYKEISVAGSTGAQTVTASTNYNFGVSLSLKPGVTPGGSGAVTVSSGTSYGNITGGALNLNTGGTDIGSSGNINLVTGAASGVGTSGNVVIDVGSVVGGTYGTISLAGTNAKAVGIGTLSPSTVLHVSGGNSTGRALSILDQLGASTNDILAASSSGITKFVIKNDGTASSAAGFTLDGAGNIQSTRNQTLTLGGGSTGNLIIGRTSQAVFLPGFDCSALGNGGKLTTTAGGALACAADTSGGGGGSSNWNLNASLGILSPINNTLDLLWGGTTTGSAKFAVLGTAAGTNPSASVSAGVNGATYISANGTIATTAKQSLNVGNTTTGDVYFNPGGTTVLTAHGNGNVGVGTTTPDAFKLEVAGNFGASDGTSMSTVTRAQDEINAEGEYVSMTVGFDGLPIIVYQDDLAGQQDLTVYKCANIGCTSGTETEIDATTANMGTYPAIAIPSDGLPVIAYHDETNGDLEFVKCGNAACSASNTITTVDSAGDVGEDLSIAIGADGLPIVIYQNKTATQSLKAAKCTNATCSTSTVSTIVSGNEYWYTSVAIGTDTFPVISYHDNGNGDLTVTKCNDIACAGTNETTTSVHNLSGVEHTSIAIGSDGFPVIAYRDSTGNDLEFLKCGNASCSSGNTQTELNASSAGSGVSLAVGSDGLPVIVFGAGAIDVRVLKCSNASCSNTATDTDTIISSNDISNYTSIAIAPDGLPIVIWRENSTADIEYMRCADPTCALSSASVPTGGFAIGGNMSGPRSGGSAFQTLNAFNVSSPNTWQKLSFQVGGIDRLALTPEGTATSSADFVLYGGNRSIQTTANNTLTVGGGTTGELIIGRTSQRVMLPGFDCSALGNGGKLTTTAGGILTCSADGGGGTAVFDTLLGTIRPGNTTLDTLLGGISSSSAALRVTGQGNPFAGTTSAASVSANTSFAGLVVDNRGVGDIFTASSSGLTRFVIKNNGNVGIGTTLPLEKLTVSGGNIAVTSPILTEKGNIKDGVGATELSFASGIFVQGKYAYVTAVTDDALTIIDISNPTAPSQIGTIKDGVGATQMDAPQAVYVAGSYAYVASSTDNSLSIIDVSNPSAPTEVGTIKDGVGATQLDGANGVYVSGKYAYLTSSIDDALSIIDVSNPSAPTEVGTIKDGVGATQMDGANALFVSGKYAYVTAQTDNALTVIDISNPTSPVEVGTIKDGIGATDLANTKQVYVVGRYAYVASASDDALTIIDVSIPSSPTQVGVIKDAIGATELDFAYAVVVAGRYAYVTGLNDDAISIIDVSDPANPIQVSAIKDAVGATQLDGPYGLFLAGRYIYAASGNDNALSVIEVSGIEAPVANIGSITSGNINVSENLRVGNAVTIGDSLNLGAGGLQSQGAFAFATVGGSGNFMQGSPIGKALLVLNQNGTQDIFSASVSGIPRFTLTNGGGIRLGTDDGDSGECLKSGGLGLAATWGTCGSGAAGTWDLNAALGIHTQGNNTTDLLLGGSSTQSAMFSVLGIAAGTNPTASVSAINGANATKGLYMAGDGSLQTVNKNTLTIGGTTTGDISFKPGNSSSSLYLASSGAIGFNGSFGTSGQCLITSGSGSAPTWGGCVSGPGGNWFTLQSAQGTIYPINTTLDLLWGGTSTASASFRLAGSAANKGTIAAASVSANTSFAGLVVDNKGSGALLTASSSGMTRFTIFNGGNVSIGDNIDSGFKLDVEGSVRIGNNTSGDDIAKQTTSDFTQSGYSVTTADSVNNIDTSNNQISLVTDMIGAGATVTAPAVGPAFGQNVGANSFTFQRPDKQFAVVNVNRARLYNPTTNTFGGSAQFTTGTVGNGLTGFQRANGTFVIVVGGGTATQIYSPGTGASFNEQGAFAAGPTTSAAVGAGSVVIRRSDGKVILVHGGSAATTSVYDPTAATGTSSLGQFLAGPTLTGNVTTGSFQFALPNGKWIVGLGGSTSTNIYDPSDTGGGISGGIFKAGPALSASSGAGAHVIQLPDGRMMVVLGGTTGATSIYNPKTNTFSAGPSLASAGTVGTGGHSFQRSDGQWVLVRGGASTALQIYDPANGADGAFSVSSSSLSAAAGAGSHTFQRPDGMYVVMHGNTSATSTLFDAGWNTSGTWTSEDINSTKISTYSAILWSANPQSANNNARFDQETLTFSVKTAPTQGELANAPWVTLHDNGLLIKAAAGANWAKIKVEFSTPVRSYQQAAAYSVFQRNIWAGEGEVFYRRSFIQPTVYSIKIQNPIVSYGDPTGNADPAFGRNFATGSAQLEGVYTDNSNRLFLSTNRNLPTATRSAGLILASASANLGATANAGTHTIERSNGQFLVIIGGSSTTRVYDSATGVFSAGPALPSASGVGSHSFLMPDGRFFTVLGNGNKTAIFDPQANVFSAGPDLFGNVGTGGNTFQRPDGFFIIVNGGVTTSTNILDPFSMAVTQGPFTLSPVGAGALNIRRSDGRIFVMHGNTQTAAPWSSLYDAALNAFVTGPALTTGSLAAGSTAVQMSNGKFWVKTATTLSQIYSQVDNTFAVGPTGNGTLTAGAVTIPRPDGKFIHIAGAVPTIIDGATVGVGVTGDSLPCTLAAGSNVFQKPTGEFVVICGNGSNTMVIDAGWNLGGTYTSEPIYNPNLSSQTGMYWKNSGQGEITVKYRTASTLQALGMASWRQLPTNGSLISPAAGDLWFQTRIDLQGVLQDLPGAKTRVWLSESNGGAVKYYQQVQAPVLQYWKLMNASDPNLLTITSNGSNMFRFNADGQAFTADNGAWNSGGADLAERYSSKEDLKAGEVVALDRFNSQHTKRSTTPYDQNTMGVVSTQPGFVAGAYTENSYPIALIGRVPVKVSTENGPIMAGDYLTSGSIPGYAMKATVGGRVLGQAMEDLVIDGESDTTCPKYGAGNLTDTKCGTVTVYVNLTSYNGQSVSVQMTEQGYTLDEKSLPSIAGIDFATDTNAKRQQEVLGFLKQQKDYGQELYTDRIAATQEIISPQIITDLLVAKRIKAESIEGLEIITNSIETLSNRISTGSAVTNFSDKLTLLAHNQQAFEEQMASLSAKLDKLGSLNLLGFAAKEGVSGDFATVENLAVFGTATFAQASVMDSFSVGNGMTITQTSINTLGEDLQIQPLKQAAVSFLDGLIRFATDGKAVFTQDVVFEQNVAVAGVLSAKTVSSAELQLAQGTSIIISDTEIEATGAAGLVTLKKNTEFVKITNPLVKANSFIFITPKTKTPSQLFLLEQNEAKDEEKASFTVGVDGKAESDIKFNYLIVN